MSPEEVLSQVRSRNLHRSQLLVLTYHKMRVLLQAGYETTASK